MFEREWGPEMRISHPVPPRHENRNDEPRPIRSHDDEGKDKSAKGCMNVLLKWRNYNSIIIILFSTNCLVLGMTSDYGEESIHIMETLFIL